MFTTEIRINNSLVLFIYGQNTTEVNKQGEYHYLIRVYSVETGKVKEFFIYHKRENGISKLIEKILAKYNK